MRLIGAAALAATMAFACPAFADGACKGPDYAASLADIQTSAAKVTTSEDPAMIAKAVDFILSKIPDGQEIAISSVGPDKAKADGKKLIIASFKDGSHSILIYGADDCNIVAAGGPGLFEPIMAPALLPHGLRMI
jgi:hypothetical protein